MCVLRPAICFLFFLTVWSVELDTAEDQVLVADDECAAENQTECALNAVQHQASKSWSRRREPSASTCAPTYNGFQRDDSMNCAYGSPCCDSSLTCYQKGWAWAGCMSSCKPGVHDQDENWEYWYPWSCEVLAAAATPAPAPEEPAELPAPAPEEPAEPTEPAPEEPVEPTEPAPAPAPIADEAPTTELRTTEAPVVKLVTTEALATTEAPATAEATTAPGGTADDASCAAAPGCAALGIMHGLCCPTAAGVHLGCCPKPTTTTTTLPPGVACADAPKCVAAGITRGACCPTPGGVRLGCCP